MNTEQKYPAEIIDKVAASIALGVDDTYLFIEDPRFPNGGLGAPHSQDYIDEMRRGAVAALDALGLAVTEEWSTLHSSGAALPAGSWAGARTRSTALGQPILHRTILHAETPWVEVVSDGE